MSTISVRTLNATHPDYDSGHLAHLAALYAGGKTWARYKEFWIPQNYAEPTDLYADRLARALYINHAAPIVDLLAAWLFEAPPAVSDAPSSVTTLEKNADGNGKPLAEFFKGCFLDALVGRRSFVWANLPAAPVDGAPTNRLSEEQMGLTQPFLVRLTPQQVIDWEADERGGLLWVMVRDVVAARSDPTAGGRTHVHRWTLIDGTRIRRWEWHGQHEGDTPKDEDMVSMVSDIEHRMGIMPVQVLTMTPGLWAMDKMHDPAVDLLRKDNDLSWALHKSAHALMVVKYGDNDIEPDAPPVVGAGYMISMPASGSVEYAEPSGASFSVLRQSKQDALQDMFRVVHQMAMAANNEATRAAASGASKTRDWEALQIVMSAYTALVADFVREVLAMVAEIAEQSPEAMRVGGMNAWKRRTLEQFLEAAVLAVGAQSMSPTFAREVAKKQAELMLKEDIDPSVLQTIYEEIDQADPFGANLALMGKQLGDDVFSATGARDAVEGQGESAQQDQADAQPAAAGGTKRAT